MKDLSAEELKQLDEYIFEGNRLLGLKFLMDRLKVGLHEVMEIFVKRYQALRKSDGGRFRESEEDYWKGFYS